MSFIDDRGRLFGKINILDIIILTIIIALTFGGIYKIMYVNTNTSMESKSIKVKLLVKEREKISLDKIKVEDVLKEYDTGFVFGKISDVKVEPATKEIETINGEIKRAEIPEKYDLYITTEANAMITENAIVSGNKELRVGNTIVFRTKLYALKSIILEIHQE